MGMLLQNTLRPIIRQLMPLHWQHEFSGWVYSNAHGPFRFFCMSAKGGRRNAWIETILHRIYWLTNPRGER